MKVCECHRDEINKHSWYIGGRYYRNSAKGALHHYIWKLHNKVIPDGYEIDHINRDRADNRIENLRLATHSQNNQNQSKRNDNSSGYIGVYKENRCERWSGDIKVDGKKIYVGCYSSPEDAAYTRDQFALQLHGEFANTNFSW